jgi:hypothetical protein
MKPSNLAPRSRLMSGLLGATLFAGGSFVGWAAHRSSALEAEVHALGREVESLAQDSGPPRGFSGSCVASVDTRALGEQLRGILQVGAAAPGAPAETTTEATKKADEPPAPEVLEVMQKGEDLLSEARASGHWTTEHALALQQLLPELDDKSRFELRLEIVRALNDKQLKMDTPLMF